MFLFEMQENIFTTRYAVGNQFRAINGMTDGMSAIQIVFMQLQDAVKNNEVCFTLSENAVGYKYCQDRMYDLELLLCARVTLTDKLVKVTDDEEKKVVLNALFTGLPGKKGQCLGRD
ncbi:unnamed protein product [Clavelina lepadiformis]|uniref:CREG-like beta-barrel domain-containing protein n=1 Tax=Clavelina lepadiformis TaxID=159417 RepID=A0ABP0G5C8_CLALP